MRGSAFGLDIVSSLPLPGPWQRSAEALFPLQIIPATQEAVDELWTGAERLGWKGRVDGQDFRVEVGRDGDLRMRLEPFVDMHLASDGTTLRVVQGGLEDVKLARVLLDSALFTVSLNLGNEALHAGAVAGPEGVIAVVGPTGAGKSSLVASLLAAGCAFVTDDVLIVRSREGSLLGLPGPPVITIPNPPPQGLGELIADLGDESWLGIGTIPDALPIAGVVHLDLTEPAKLVTASPGLRELLVHFLRFPRTRARERSRFELAAELALHVPTLRLSRTDGSPEQLAGRVLNWI